MRAVNPVNPGARLGMAFDAWPAADQAAWTDAFQPGRPKPRPRNGARLRPATRITMATCYARWLAWLAANDQGSLAEGPGERATRDRVIDYLHALEGDVTFRTMLGYACRLKRALELIAPIRDWAWFNPLIEMIDREAQAEPKPRRPFVPADKLFSFGIELMEAASTDITLPAYKQAEAFRDGLLISFLASRPLRLKNMIELEIGTQLSETASGYEVTLRSENTKTHRELEFPMPDALVPFLRRYVADFRPTLAAGADHLLCAGVAASRMWLTWRGTPFPVATFEDMIGRRTLGRFDKRLRPQDFRHCVATSIADFHPEEAHIIRIILGHATTGMADAYYIHAKGIKAARKVQANIARTRKAMRKRL